MVNGAILKILSFGFVGSNPTATIKYLKKYLDLILNYYLIMSLVGGKYSPIWGVPLEEFKEIVKKSYSYTQVAREIGLTNGGFCVTVKNRIRREKIDASHFDPKRNHKKS